MDFTRNGQRRLFRGRRALLVLFGERGVTRAAAVAGSDQRDPLVLPIRFHGELLGRAAGRQGRPGMPQAQPRQAFGGCQTAVSAIAPPPAAPAAAAAPAPPPLPPPRPAGTLPAHRRPRPRPPASHRPQSRRPAAKSGAPGRRPQPPPPPPPATRRRQPQPAGTAARVAADAAAAAHASSRRSAAARPASTYVRRPAARSVAAGARLPRASRPRACPPPVTRRCPR